MKKLKRRITKLFHSYAPDIRRFLRCYTSKEEDIEDILQETFLRAQAKMDWTRIDNPKAYLMRTAHNLFQDNIRRNKNSLIDFCDDIEYRELDALCKLPTPEQSAIIKSEFRLLADAISRLTPKVQQALILNKFFQLSYKEVAQKMKISPKTVEKHIAKGVLNVQQSFLSEEFESHSAQGKSDVNIISMSKHQKK